MGQTDTPIKSGIKEQSVIKERNMISRWSNWKELFDDGGKTSNGGKLWTQI